MMNQLDRQGQGSDLEIDLESGGTSDEDVGDDNADSSCVNPKKGMQKVWSKVAGQELPDGSAERMQSFDSLSRLSNLDESHVKNAENWPDISRELRGNVSGKKATREESKKPDSVRHPKPPRPPRGPSLDASDTRFVKEVSELAILKRKRAERMRLLQKMRKEKASSMSSSSIFATVITVVFLMVIIFQGFLGPRT